MKVVYDAEKQRVPIKIWSDLATVEPAAMSQLQNMAGLPFVFKHVAAMPDVHLGKGATVGSVVATKGAVIPAAVGVDIGCGMMAVQLQIEPGRIHDRVSEIRSAIEAVVPVGHRSNSEANAQVLNWVGWQSWGHIFAVAQHTKTNTELKHRAIHQLGSLGGGNHFIELCTDTEGKIWVMLHSGSRNIGKSLAEIHIARAKGVMKQMFINLPDPDLAYYAEETADYDHYMGDLYWAQAYAMENRRVMMSRVLKVISDIANAGNTIGISHETNCHHNYAEKENHYGENVLVTRKGAVRARKGDFGIIPGSMGTKSYIVEGLGSADSFCSCSHGAGRAMSRSEAKRRFTLDDLAKQTEGVDCRKDDGVLDEIPASYKDIDVVMENQKDLVRVVAQLKQFLCIKG